LLLPRDNVRRPAVGSLDLSRMPRKSAHRNARPQGALDLATVAQLRACANRCGGDSAARKSEALRKCAAGAIDDADALLAYHDVLLFLLAYPESRALRAAAASELARVAQAARNIEAQGTARARAKLANSGVAWAPMTIAFGYDIARWLATRHRGCGEIDSFDDTGQPLHEFLRHALPAPEFELLEADGIASKAFLATASEGHTGTRLDWLVAQTERLRCDERLREYLFDSLKAFVTLRPADGPLSRTFVRGLPARIHYHRKELRRTVDPRAILDAPLAPARRLTPRERWHLVDTGRAMLASLGRETDAIAACGPEGVEFHALGRGAALALYAMRPERRLPLDSHIGFMLFKNAVPAGYGGAWPFLGTAKVGVNIFEPFRGGESAYLFCQVLRVYRQRFGIDHFIAEPSQFGGGNREGLLSGAFWFYYRLGFRPVTPAIAALAASEFARIGREPRYRAPLTVLRRFTRSDIELRLAPANEAATACDPADLSLAVSAWIAACFDGDRTAAEAYAMRVVTRALGVRATVAWMPAERAALRSLCLLLARVPDLAQWPARDKAGLVAIIRAKGGDEFRYFDLLRGHSRAQAALRALVAAPER
jgi:hypothetical protein